MTIAAIIYTLMALIPISAVLLALRWAWRKCGLRLRRQKVVLETSEAVRTGD